MIQKLISAFMIEREVLIIGTQKKRYEMLDVHKFVHRDMIIPLNAELNPACHLLAS
jgi:hypothetical protein